MIFDLHTHSDASDGSLTPTELVSLAAENNVNVLSITDHDTVAAYDRISDGYCSSVALIPGIELSTTWSGRGIHIVGLNIDPASIELRRGIERQQSARHVRAQTIAKRLTKLGIDNPFDAVLANANGAGIGRPHFARHLVDIGVVKDVATAFRKYLGPGKPGDIKSGWGSLDETVSWILCAGGTAVLAHPAKYKFTTSKLRLLLDDFVTAGGRALEVVSGPQDPGVTRRMANLARDFGLAASSGSDFHHPGLTWSAPGRFAELPADIGKVWDSW
ncbi:MAG: PHP domain-containing protein [Gammaproteobacteria bacterium]|nr:PHP domain-containing protein [Gammaproteobacteria bacterium]